MTTVTVHPSPELAAASQTQQPQQQPQAAPGAFPQAQPVIPTAGPVGHGAPAVPNGGPQVAPVETPSQAIISHDRTTVRVTDARGRTFGIRKPTAIERVKLSRVLGGELVSNSYYFMHAMFAYCVREFDGRQEPPPGTVAQIEAMIERLDDDGIEAVGKGFSELGIGTASSEVAEAAKN